MRQLIGNKFAFGITLLIFALGRDELDRCSLGCDAARGFSCSADARVAHVFSSEDAGLVIGSGGRGSSAENELVSGETGSLVGLEHIVSPAILSG